MDFPETTWKLIYLIERAVKVPGMVPRRGTNRQDQQLNPALTWLLVLFCLVFLDIGSLFHLIDIVLAWFSVRLAPFNIWNRNGCTLYRQWKGVNWQQNETENGFDY